MVYIIGRELYEDLVQFGGRSAAGSCMQTGAAEEGPQTSAASQPSHLHLPVQQVSGPINLH